MNSFAILLSAAGLYAQGSNACSNQTLQGTYGVNISGTRPAPRILPGIPGSFLPGYPEQIIGVVIQTFDGNGNFTQADNVKGSLSGVIMFDRPGAGTYSVNADCSGTYAIHNAGVPFPLVVRFVTVDGGKEFRGVVVSPESVMVTALGRKVD
jgi:hypothetical protein